MKGQINSDSSLGEIIENFASNESYNSFLEIGTWNGLGSTRCFWRGFQKRQSPYSFVSLESSKEFFDMAVSNNKDIISDRFKILLGRIVGLDDIKKFGFDIESLKLSGQYLPEYDSFMKYDVSAYENSPILEVGDMFSGSIDVCLLDGGKFSSFAEFKTLKNLVKVFILDDVKMLKNKKVEKELISENWSVLFKSEERHGFSVLEKA